MVLDIPLFNISGVDDGDAQKKAQFAMQRGILSSALEHAVPEQMFVNAENPGEAISAVKALQKANDLGQRIYQITQANQSSILGNIHHDSATMDEIRNELAAGKEVITHTDALSVPGWSGAGYVIYDPKTGDGAYKIAGGGNGAAQILLDTSLFAVAAALGYVDGSAGLYLDKNYLFADKLNWLAKLAKASQLLGYLALLVSIALIWNNDDLSWTNKLAQISTTILGFGVVSYITGAAVGLLGVGGLAVIIAVVTAISIAVSITLINAMYFSYMSTGSRRRYA